MLRLIRYKNLIFTALLQLLVYGCIILPTLQSYQFDESLGIVKLLTLVLSTVFITAGGYVINDYFDLKIDRINRPDKVIVGTLITKEQTMKLYQALTITGIALGIYLAFSLKSITLGFIYIVVPGMLWFYSSSYKRMLIVGNLIVAFCAALVPLMPMLAMQQILETNWSSDIYNTPIIRELYTFVGVIAIFAFLWTFIREIIKDMQDVYGDRELECHTIPVVWGGKTARIIVIALIVITCALLIWLSTKADIGHNTTLTLKYAVWGIVLPSVCLIGILLKNDLSAPRNASNLCKFIMLIGTCYCIVYNIMMAQGYDVTLFGLFKLA
ncbi:MAG: geranylgeranylglycerol-phosphate geranylgeranyltransferase [Bacteroidales bacterium]|nr:geranylgeranylglycerol-phosphate geranylgeranyltransferase [Bacteroidales bacterium]